MKFRPENHIIGKVYDLTQENMQAMLLEIDRLRSALKLCAARAGYPEPTQACVLVINTVERALKGDADV